MANPAAAVPVTLAELACDAALAAGRIQGLCFALHVGSTDPRQLIDEIDATAHRLGQVAEYAAAPERHEQAITVERPAPLDDSTPRGDRA